MLKTPMPTQHELEMVTLEELVPKDHLLRQIDAAVAPSEFAAKHRATADAPAAFQELV
ncbi:hypothetical protein [Burkholderia mallei]|uniref:hypothetical protein n=1 Tax=Burkholderia mallei TaxID=13373 RepID=UPI0015C50FB5|nr:hypothetical protein [Burkholderia mallei]